MEFQIESHILLKNLNLPFPLIRASGEAQFSLAGFLNPVSSADIDGKECIYSYAKPPFELDRK